MVVLVLTGSGGGDDVNGSIATASPATTKAATGAAANGQFNMCLGANVFCAIFPIRTSGMVRLMFDRDTLLASADEAGITVVGRERA